VAGSRPKGASKTTPSSLAACSTSRQPPPEAVRPGSQLCPAGSTSQLHSVEDWSTSPICVKSVQSMSARRETKPGAESAALPSTANSKTKRSAPEKVTASSQRIRARGCASAKLLLPNSASASTRMRARPGSPRTRARPSSPSALSSCGALPT